MKWRVLLYVLAICVGIYEVCRGDLNDVYIGLLLLASTVMCIHFEGK